jgi:hypothetical protein
MAGRRLASTCRKQGIRIRCRRGSHGCALGPTNAGSGHGPIPLRQRRPDRRTPAPPQPRHPLQNQAISSGCNNCIKYNQCRVIAVPIELRPIDEVTPYAGNPRRNDSAVDAVAGSLKEFGRGSRAWSTRGRSWWSGTPARRPPAGSGLAGTVEQGLTDPDAVPEPPADPVTQPGDPWVLGSHRLLCGDTAASARTIRACTTRTGTPGSGATTGTAGTRRPHRRSAGARQRGPARPTGRVAGHAAPAAAFGYPVP